MIELVGVGEGDDEEIKFRKISERSSLGNVQRKSQGDMVQSTETSRIADEARLTITLLIILTSAFMI